MQIGIIGAGSVGCYCGGMLAAHGDAPVLVGRRAMEERLADGMVLTRHDGPEKAARKGTFSFSGDAAALAGCDAVLITVKSGDTEAAGNALAGVLGKDSIVVSLQNGIGNDARLRRLLPGNRVLAGMVAFNVAQIGDNRFHRGTEGAIAIGDGKGALSVAAALVAAGIPAEVRADIEAVQWGKLILNLNNAVNSLSGLPLRQQLSDRQWRLVLAASVREALAVVKRAGIRPAKLGKVPPALIPAILELPDWLFARLAVSILKVDENARSSMAEDLERGRQPEIDWLNGEIVRLAQANGAQAPVNEAIIEAVKKLFAGKPPVHPDAGAVLAAIAAARRTAGEG
jgi:2-dehydropantoate 2-reductase